MIPFPKLKVHPVLLGNRRLIVFLIFIVVLWFLFIAKEIQRIPGKSITSKWLLKIDSLDQGEKEGWFKSGYDRSSWQEKEIRNWWERNISICQPSGKYWYATSFSSKKTSKLLSLYFGGVDDASVVWINGIKIVSKDGYSNAFTFDISSAWHIGENKIVVQITNCGGPAELYAPVVLIPTNEIDQVSKSPIAKQNARLSEDWVHNSVLYEVNLRAFSQEYAFKEIQAHIPDFKRLGINVLCLTPIHPVGELNKKGILGNPYSVKDFYSVSSEYGSLHDFKSLIEAAHSNGMYVTIDLVANCTSWDNDMLVQHPDWYIQNESGEIVAPALGLDDVAKLNYDHHELRKYMITLMKYWVEKVGIDGYRCSDAANVPTDFWDIARDQLEKIKPIIMISSTSAPEDHLKAFDLTYSSDLDVLMTKIVQGQTSVNVFSEMVQSEIDQFPIGSLRVRFTGNCSASSLGDSYRAFFHKLIQAETVLKYTLPGIPILYTGEDMCAKYTMDFSESQNIDWTTRSDCRSLCESMEALRLSHPALLRGRFLQLKTTGGERILSFMRRWQSDEVIVTLNLMNRNQNVKVQLDSSIAHYWINYSHNAEYRAEQSELNITIPAYDYVLLVPFP